MLLITIFIITEEIRGQETQPFRKNTQNSTFEEEIERLKLQADSLFNANKNKQAEEAYDQAYQKAKQSKNDSLFIRTGNDYTFFLTVMIVNISKAKKVNQNILEFSDKNNDRAGLIDAYALNALIIDRQGHEFEALKVYSKAIDLIDERVPKRLISSSYHRRGRLLLRMNQHAHARKDFHRSLSNIDGQNDEKRRLELYLLISTSFEKDYSKEVDSSNYYHNAIIDYCNKKDDLDQTCLGAYNNIAYKYLLNNKPEKAKKLLQENFTEEYILKLRSTSSLTYGAVMHTYGKMHMDLGEYDAAIEKFEIVKEQAIKNRYLTSALVTLEDLSEAYEKNGDLKSSLETIRMIKPLMDTLDAQKIQKELAKLETQRKLKEKEKQINALLEEKQTITLKMSTAQLTSYILGALLLIGMFIFFNRMWANKVKFHKLNEKVNHNRLLSLQSAMNPHFLFNTFGTLQHFILKKQVEKANSYMTTLSDLIRNVFASSNSIYIRFNNEINILQSYIDLELGRFDHNFEVAFDIPRTLSDDNPLIPAMILQPYIENAIIHGFSEKKGEKKLVLRFAYLSSKTIQCDITDNGVGREKVAEIQGKSTAKKNLSIATRNTQERLRIINKKDEQKGDIVIKDLYDTDGNATGTKVIISLPVIKYKSK